MKITLYNRQKDLPINSKEIRLLLRALFSFEKIQTDEIIVHFVGEKEISSLHETYFNDPTPTDCINFPIDGLNKNPYHHVIGEIFISPLAALRFVKKKSDPYFELSLYLVHSLLHLIGFDDLKKEERKKMRLKEKFLLKLLHENNLLLSSSL